MDCDLPGRHGRDRVRPFLSPSVPPRTVSPIFMPSVMLTAGDDVLARLRESFGIVVTLALASLAASRPRSCTSPTGRAEDGACFRSRHASSSCSSCFPEKVGANRYFTQRPLWVSWLTTHPRGIVADYPLANNASDSTMERADYWYAQFDRDPAFEILGDKYFLLHQRHPEYPASRRADPQRPCCRRPGRRGCPLRRHPRRRLPRDEAPASRAELAAGLARPPREHPHLLRSAGPYHDQDDSSVAPTADCKAPGVEVSEDRALKESWPNPSGFHGSVARADHRKRRA